MKKTVRAVCLLLAICLALSGVISIFTTRAENVLPDGVGMLLDFNSSGAVNKMTCGNATDIKYDETEGAMRVAAKQENVVNSTTLMLNFPGVSGNTAEYPVIAMRVKLSRADMATSSNATPRLGYWINGENTATGDCLGSAYKSTEEWQTVYIDFSNYSVTVNKNNHKYFTDADSALSYRRLDFYLYDHKKTDISTDDIFYVQWVGAFDSVESVYRYSEMTYSTAVTFHEDINLKYLNAQQQQAVIGEQGNVTLTETTSTAALSYSESENALMVTPKQLGKDRGFMLNVSRLSISADKYPVMAYKLRLTDSETGDIRYTYYAGTSTLEYSVALSTSGTVGKSDPMYTSLTRNQVNTNNYAPLGDSNKITDWQLMMTDFSDSTNTFGMGANAKYWTEDFGGYWSYVQLALPNYRSGSTYPSSYLEPYYVEWVGFFSDIESARDYAAMPPKTMYLFDDKATVNLAAANGDNTEIVYDTANNYMTVKAKKFEETAANAYCFTMNVAGEYLNSAEYPVLAMRVRLRHRDMTAKSNFTLMGTTEMIGIDKVKDPDGKVSGYTNAFLGGGGNYLPTTDWQTVYFDFSDKSNPRYEYYSSGEKASNITTVLINMYKYNFTGYAQEDEFDVQWVGFFTDASAALAETGEALPEPVENVVTFGNMRNSSLVTAGGNTVLRYDAEESSIAISPKNNDTLDASYISINMTQFKLNSAEYPIAAIKVKAENIGAFLKSTPVLSNMTVKIGQDRQSGVLAGSYITGMSRKYKNSKDWQIIYFDFSNREYSRSAYFAEGELASDWSVLAFSAFNYKYDQAKTEDELNVEWFGVFRSRDELDKYAGIERKEGGFFYDLSDPNNIGEVYNTGYDSQISYDETQKALKVVAYDMNFDNALTTNVAGFSLGEAGGNEIETISPTEKYPVLAVRVKLKKPKSSPGWFYFRASSGSTDYPISRPYYQETDGWQTVAVDCSKESIMTYYFNGNWTGCTLALGVNGLTEPGETFYVKWVGSFKTVEEAFAYTGEKVPEKPVKKPISDNQTSTEPEEVPKQPEEQPTVEVEKTYEVSDLMRIKSAAANVVKMDDKKVYVKQVMTAERFLSAFVTADGVKIVVANPKGLLLREQTPVYDGYTLIIKKDGVEQMRFEISAPPRTMEVQSGTFLDTWQIVLICLGAVVVAASVAVVIILIVRRRSAKKTAV